MTIVLNKIFNESAMDYFSETDHKELIKYCKTIDFRFQVLREIELVESEIINKCVENMIIKYPTMNDYVNVKEKTYRDMCIVLRYCCQSMIKDDPQFLKDQLLFWFRTIIQSFGFASGVIRDTYEDMEKLLKEKIDAKSYKFVAPYISTVLEILPEKTK